MKKQLPLLLLTVLLFVPQFFFSSYTFILGFWVVVGMIYTMAEQQNKLFLKALIIQAVISVALYFGFADNNLFYLKPILGEYSGYLSVAVILFNVITAPLAVLGGSMLVMIFAPPGLPEQNEDEEETGNTSVLNIVEE